MIEVLGWFSVSRTSRHRQGLRVLLILVKCLPTGCLCMHVLSPTTDRLKSYARSSHLLFWPGVDLSSEMNIYISTLRI